MSVPQIIVGVLGVLFSLVLYKSVRQLRLMAILLFMIGVAVTVTGIRGDVVQAIVPIRMRLTMGLLTFIILYVTLEAVRRNRLKERYALLWVGTGGVFFIFALYPDLVEQLVKLTGMHYITTIVVLVFAFLVLLAFHISLALSRNEEDRRALAKTVALLEERIASLEKNDQKKGSDRTP